MLVEEAGWVDGAWVRAQAAPLRHGDDDSPVRLPHGSALWHVAATELWLRVHAGAEPGGANPLH
jgi:hypothetical protein